MSAPTVFLFSGQGSQQYRMGAQLYREEPVFRAEMDRFDAMVAELCGQSVLARLYHGGRAGEPFTDTLVTHPAIVMVELAMVELLRADGIVADLMLGASLGEFTAAAASGVLTVEECLRLVVAQARALEGLPPGGMLAVLADPGLHQRMPQLREHTDLAARNGPEHFVISGAEEDLVAAEAALRAAEVPCQRVAVEHAFHSRLLDSRREACRGLLDGLVLREPRIPIFSCATGVQVRQPTPEHYWQVVSGPIEFERAIRGLEATGPHRYVDLGPSGTLHNLTAALLGPARSRSYPLLSVFGHDCRLLADVRTAFRPSTTTPTSVAATAEGVRMKVYGFPGQGSQAQGMGADLFDRFPAQVAAADAVLGYSVRELCERNPQGRLRQTEYTQPALYTVSALSYLARLEDDPVAPDYLVGHSLGEYAALFAAGVFDFETGLRLVARRGELMGQAAVGAMAAVVGCDLSTVESLIAGIDGVSVANINAVDQVVLAGPDGGIDAVKPLVEAAGGRYVRLRVSGALHSPFVSGAAEEFGRFLHTVQLAPPRIPVIANVDAQPHDAEGMRTRLTRQIDSPVRWLDMMRHLMDRGEFEFVELGPGRVLRNLVAKIRQRAADEQAAVASTETVAPPPATVTVAPAQPAVMDALAPEQPAATPAQPAEDGAPPASVAAGRPEDAELGAATFRARYGLRHACVAGSMYGAVSGVDLLSRLSRAGGMGFYGAGGCTLAEVEDGVGKVVAELGRNSQFGANLPYHPGDPGRELALVELYLRLGVGVIEASGYLEITPALVMFRLKGGSVLAKVNRSDLAEQMLSPAPADVVRHLRDHGHVTADEAARAAALPVATDVVVEAGSGWLTGPATTATLLPSVLRLRDRLAIGPERVHVGAAGGISTPEAAGAALLMGAEFLLTGSINQCTVEAATSPLAKDILQSLSVHDVDVAPWAEMFELGAKNTVARKGLFYPARAMKLYELWRAHDRYTDIDPATRDQIERRYLLRPFAEVLAEVGGTANPKEDMAAVFRAYLTQGLALARAGEPGRRVDYHIPCGPAMGAFNDWVRGTELEPWQRRNVDTITEHLLTATAKLLGEQARRFVR
ncbi:ACP S-malonyltransferase [Micromonospora sp. NPDC002296]|uniref:ACP S-malonyltransferase n=1 Tax=Micromonospora sp. NPDC002296 TaxID=3154271 RepID=UPI00332E0F38